MTESVAPMQLRTSGRMDEGTSVSATAAPVALAAGLVYAALFARTAFFDYLRERGQTDHLGLVLGTLALGALAGSAASARTYREHRARWLVAGGFLGCLLGALHAIVATSWPLPVSGALLVGVASGWTTVAVVMCLRPSIRHRRLGRWIGLGVGGAYAFCSQPAIFQASTEKKVFIAAGAAAIGLLAAFFLRNGPVRRSSAPDYRMAPTRYWVIFFFVLACLETLGGCVIENVPHLKLRMWEGGLPLQGNALIHLAIAVLAGFALDHHRSGATAAMGLAFVAASSLLLIRATGQPVVAHFLHVAGASTLATCWLHLGARGGRPWPAAALAGAVWLGTALALGPAQSWTSLPLILALAGIGAGATSLYLRQRAVDLALQERG